MHGFVTRPRYEIHHHEHFPSVTLSGCLCVCEAGSLREEQKLKDVCEKKTEKKRVASNVPIVAIDVTSGPLTVTCD